MFAQKMTAEIRIHHDVHTCLHTILWFLAHKTCAVVVFVFVTHHSVLKGALLVCNKWLFKLLLAYC